MSDQTNSFLGTEQQPSYTPTSDEKTLAPLIIYLMKKDQSKYVESHAKESLNFQLTIFIICVGLAITVIGLFFIWIVGIIALVFVIIATIKASENKLYKYPVNIRFIK
jgi:uncharacterized Tic20 family protein